MANPVLANRYEIQQQLGQKPGHRTLLALDQKTQDLVVIKVISFADEVEWDNIKLFEREAETLRNLRHPLIPAYLDHFEVNLRGGKGFALVQTHISGNSLESYIQTKTMLAEAELQKIATALLEILIYLHRQQPPVIHRDIKPSNVILSVHNNNTIEQIYLIDFGSVQNFKERPEGNSFTLVGTYGYTPPEQLAGRAIAASDLYSLGATLIAAACGTHPSSLPQRGMRIDFGSIVSLSHAFTDWLKLMTEPRIERRFASAQEALTALTQPKTPNAGIVQKPPESKIRLIKQPNLLEISLIGLAGRVRLRIDQTQISLTNELLGLQFKPCQPADRKAITKLEAIQPNSRSADGDNPLLIIWVGNQRFELGNDLIMTEAELDWLAYEISTWLQIPVD